MKNYIYLVERKSDKVKFITYGNFKEAENTKGGQKLPNNQPPNVTIHLIE